MQIFNVLFSVNLDAVKFELFLKQKKVGKNQHVVEHSNGWAVKGEGNSKATVVTKTQEQAIDKGRVIAQNQEAELLIHGRNGQIRDRDSYGNDPFPPKG